MRHAPWHPRPTHYCSEGTAVTHLQHRQSWNSFLTARSGLEACARQGHHCRFALEGFSFISGTTSTAAAVRALRRVAYETPAMLRKWRLNYHRHTPVMRSNEEDSEIATSRMSNSLQLKPRCGEGPHHSPCARFDWDVGDSSSWGQTCWSC